MNPIDFPRQFPVEHAATIGRVLMGAEEPGRQHLFPAYCLQGYVMGLFVDPIQPTFGSKPTGLVVQPFGEKQAGEFLVREAQAVGGFAAAGEERGSAAWLLLQPILGALIERIFRKILSEPEPAS